MSRSYCFEWLRTYGERCGVRATPHQLRHSCATRLLNAGARLETIQHLPGHEYVRTTQVYARVHDKTVASDYYRAMAVVKERVVLETEPANDIFWPHLAALLDRVVAALGDPSRQVLHGLGQLLGSMPAAAISTARFLMNCAHEPS